jgi:hypothetical protein
MIKEKIARDKIERYRPDMVFNESSLQMEGNHFLPENFPGKKTYILTDVPVLVKHESKLGPMIKSLDGFSNEDISNSVFYIYFNFDNEALPFLTRIRENGGIFIPPVLTGKIEYHSANSYAFDSIVTSQFKSHRISHVNPAVWNNICEALDITKKLKGDYVEIGVYRGGSALVAMNCIDFMRQDDIIEERKVYLMDTFDGFDYDEAQTSPDQIWKNTHKIFGAEETISYLKETFKDIDTNYELIKSNICKDNLPNDIKQIVVANIDVDMYEPTLDALNKVTDLIVSGGIIICEDAASTPGLYGGYLAMEEFLKSEKGQSYVKVFKGGQYFLIKS